MRTFDIVALVLVTMAGAAGAASGAHPPWSADGSGMGGGLRAEEELVFTLSRPATPPSPLVHSLSLPREGLAPLVHQWSHPDGGSAPLVESLSPSGEGEAALAQSLSQPELGVAPLTQSWSLGITSGSGSASGEPEPR